MHREASNLLEFLVVTERLKRELRHSWLSDGRRESVAEHTWQMALMALLSHRHLEHFVDIARVLKMVLVHDLVEAIAGDVPFFEMSERKARKSEIEQAAIAEIKQRIGGETGQEVYDLWQEFEARTTSEAKFAVALDNLEVQLQHNLSSLESWEPIEYQLVYTKMDKHCAHDAFLVELCAEVKRRAEEKMRAGGVDITEVKARLPHIPEST